MFERKCPIELSRRCTDTTLPSKSWNGAGVRICLCSSSFPVCTSSVLLGIRMQRDEALGRLAPEDNVGSIGDIADTSVDKVNEGVKAVVVIVPEDVGHVLRVRDDHQLLNLPRAERTASVCNQSRRWTGVNKAQLFQFRRKYGLGMGIETGSILRTWIVRDLSRISYSLASPSLSWNH